MIRRTLVVWLLVPVFSFPLFAQRYAVFPQFASGGGWSTDIFLQNQGMSPVLGIWVVFYDDSGQRVGVNSNLGSGSSFNFDLGGGRTQLIRVSAALSQLTGYVVIRLPSSDSPVVGTEVFRLASDGTILAELGVPMQDPPGINYSFPVEINSSSGVDTGIALANPTYDSASATSQTVLVNLIGSDGTLQKTVPVSLGVGEHRSLFLGGGPSALFGDLGNFTGSVSVTGGNAVAVLALRQDQNAYGAVTIATGPMVGAFAVAGTPITGSTSNTFPSKAQALSGDSIAVSGTVSAVGATGEIDYYTITGRQNDVVSIACNTQGLSSTLDSEIGLGTYNGSTVTFLVANDQNEIRGQNDSFIQAVLPADGTYYIAVHDYNSGGGNTYRYTLHVKLIR